MVGRPCLSASALQPTTTPHSGTRLTHFLPTHTQPACITTFKVNTYRKNGGGGTITTAMSTRHATAPNGQNVRCGDPQRYATLALAAVPLCLLRYLALRGLKANPSSSGQAGGPLPVPWPQPVPVSRLANAWRTAGLAQTHLRASRFGGQTRPVKGMENHDATHR
jgi:hypothetical protein